MSYFDATDIYFSHVKFVQALVECCQNPHESLINYLKETKVEANKAHERWLEKLRRSDIQPSASFSLPPYPL
jgi:hypothetical protein